MSSLLLDTNAFIWVTDHKRAHNLGKHAERLIKKSPIVYVSAVTLVEINIKTMIKKIKLPADIQKGIQEAQLTMLDLTASHAEEISSFQSIVRHDPFDRMLLAQAYAENLVFITSDQILLELNLPNVITAAK